MVAVSKNSVSIGNAEQPGGLAVQVFLHYKPRRCASFPDQASHFVVPAQAGTHAELAGTQRLAYPLSMDPRLRGDATSAVALWALEQMAKSG